MPDAVTSVVLKGLPMVADPLGPPGSGLFPSVTQHLMNVCKPTKLMLRCTSATFDTAGFGFAPQYGSTRQAAIDRSPAFSGARTGLTAEGPFIEYIPARPDYDKARKTIRTDTFAKIGGVHSEASRRFIFDATTNRPICLPYAGEVHLLATYPGQWSFEWVSFEWDENQISPIESEVTLSLQLRDDGFNPKNRIFGVPVGAHSLTYRDSHTTDTVWPTISVAMDDTTRARVVTPAGTLTSTSALKDPMGQSGQFLGRVGLGNVRTVRIDGVNGNPGQGVATFHISLV